MRRALLIFALLAFPVAAQPMRAAGQSEAAKAATQATDTSQPENIDGIAVRIESDVITESQVEELAAYQKLVDGKAQPRAEVVRELIDQWIVRGEATAAQYPQPTPADVDTAFAALQKQIGSPADFRKQCDAAGISEAAVRRILQQQIYLARFLDFRFRPAVQIDAAQVQKYYDQVLAPPLKSRGEKIPPLSDVQPEIREVLIQQAIDTLSKQWLEDTRSGLTIDILPQGAGQ